MASTKSSPMLLSLMHSRSSPHLSSPFKSPGTVSSKRAADEIPSPSPKRPKMDYHRRTTLWSYAEATSVGAYSTHQMRKTAALKAKKLDREKNYDTKKTEVQAVDELPSSQSEVFTLQNADQWQWKAIADGARRATLATALRCLYDSFFFSCGYLPRWDPWIKEAEPYAKKNQRFQTRSECIRNNRELLREHGIDDSVLHYLNGDKSRYHENHNEIHEMVVSCVAAALTQLTATCSPKRTNAYLLAWTMVTGHDRFEDGVDDDRVMGSKGIQTDDWVLGVMSDDDNDEMGDELARNAGDGQFDTPWVQDSRGAHGRVQGEWRDSAVQEKEEEEEYI